MRSSEELHKLTDSVYKHLTEGFNPDVKNLIVCGRAYHKALTGMTVVARSYVDAIAKLGHNCRLACKGATQELGESLYQVADSYKHVQIQIEEATKNLLTDFLTPLENKLESEFRVETIAHHRRYHQGHKAIFAPYEKSQRTLNKARRKSKSRGLVDDSQFAAKVNLSREKLDKFRQQGLKLALLDERKYYCYVLDKCTYMAKIYAEVHKKGHEVISSRLRDWERVSFQPNILPESSDALLDIAQTGNGYMPSPSRGDYGYEDPYRRAPPPGNYLRPQSMPGYAPGPPENFRENPTLSRMTSVPPTATKVTHVRAVYNHVAEGESQLSFTEGDIINLLGDKSDGWHYGQNTRTTKYGWFPMSFTEPLDRGSALSVSQHYKSTGDLLDNNSISDQGSLDQETGFFRRPRSLYDGSNARPVVQPFQQSGSADWGHMMGMPPYGLYGQGEVTLPRPTAIHSPSLPAYSTLPHPHQHHPQPYDTEVYSNSLYGSMTAWQHQQPIYSPPSPPLPPPPAPPPPETPPPTLGDFRRGPSIMSRSSMNRYSEPPTPARSVVSDRGAPGPPRKSAPLPPPLKSAPPPVMPKSAPNTPMNTPRKRINVTSSISSSSNTPLSQNVNPPQERSLSPYQHNSDYQSPPPPAPVPPGVQGYQDPRHSGVSHSSQPPNAPSVISQPSTDPQDEEDGGGDKNSLLAGVKLKRTATNDRSAPRF